MSLPQNLRYRLEYAGFRLAEAGAHALPLETASWLSGKLWRLIAPLLYRQKRALANLALAFPEKSLGERRQIAAGMWENLGRTFAETFHIPELVESGRIAFEPKEQFDEIASGGPFISCGMHLGNWEIIGHGGKRLGVPLTGVYQRLSNPLVDAETLRLRAPLYEAGLLPKTPVTARTLLRVAKEGGYPCFLADLRDDRGALVPFFGHPTRSNVFPALLARMSGRPLYATAVFRRPNVRFVIRIAPIPVPHTDDRDADALAATAAMHRQFETFIREAPEQWMWAHRKWD
jgi:Kdo2-lipid IVA lauroyltransferase/acyltransferase